MKLKNIDITLNYIQFVNNIKETLPIRLTLQCYYNDIELVNFVQDHFRIHNTIYNVYNDFKKDSFDKNTIYCKFDHEDKILSEAKCVRAFLPVVNKRLALHIKKEGLLEKFIEDDFSLNVYIFDVPFDKYYLASFRDINVN